MKSYIVSSPSTDPYFNLALEEALLENAPEDSCTLYLWRNAHTVVIGRNQNAWAECRTALLQREGGRLARRTSGGGAVYHDTGNLNFTFVCSKNVYDLSRQLGTIAAALKTLGIMAEFSGRNDLVCGGRKFSGNAFRHLQGASLHHGTLMVATDHELLGRYLTVSPDKLKSKGIASVKSRVCNLSEFLPSLTPQVLAGALEAAFAAEYGTPLPFPEPDGFDAAVNKKAEVFGSWQWLYGASPKMNMELSRRFKWGGVTLALAVAEGQVTDAVCYSDAMNEQAILMLPGLIKGVRLEPQQLAAAVRGLPEYGADVAAWLVEAEI